VNFLREQKICRPTPSNIPPLDSPDAVVIQYPATERAINEWRSNSDKAVQRALEDGGENAHITFIEPSMNTHRTLTPNRMEWNEIEKNRRAGKPATRLSPPLPDYASLKGKIPEGRIRLLWADYEAMCAGRRASNTIAESVLCAMLSKLLDKIATDGITPEAVCYGLEAAIMKQADNINYVLNAARGYSPPGKMPDKPPPKATPMFSPKRGVEVSEEVV
jgi:hypothetical protein